MDQEKIVHISKIETLMTMRVLVTRSLYKQILYPNFTGEYWKEITFLKMMALNLVVNTYESHPYEEFKKKLQESWSETDRSIRKVIFYVNFEGEQTVCFFLRGQYE